MKTKKKNKVLEQVKASRKQSREEELKTHGKPINYRKIMESKKVYNRKKNKADADEALPYLYINSRGQATSETTIQGTNDFPVALINIIMRLGNRLSLTKYNQ